MQVPPPHDARSLAPRPDADPNSREGSDGPREIHPDNAPAPEGPEGWSLSHHVEVPFVRRDLHERDARRDAEHEEESLKQEWADERFRAWPGERKVEQDESCKNEPDQLCLGFVSNERRWFSVSPGSMFSILLISSLMTRS